MRHWPCKCQATCQCLLINETKLGCHTGAMTERGELEVACWRYGAHTLSLLCPCIDSARSVAPLSHATSRRCYRAWIAWLETAPCSIASSTDLGCASPGTGCTTWFLISPSLQRLEFCRCKHTWIQLWSKPQWLQGLPHPPALHSWLSNIFGQPPTIWGFSSFSDALVLFFAHKLN